MSENQTPETEAATEASEAKAEQTFTQADVDRIVRERVKREREKYADYDDLKAKAGEARTAEDRIAALEAEVQQSKREAAVSRVIAEFKLDDKQALALKYAPDEEAAREIAEGLTASESERKKHGNHVPREGTNPQAGDDPMREFTRGLFAKAASE